MRTTVATVVTSTLLVGCTPEPSGAIDLADAIAPHEAEIERFVQWAHRATRGSSPREHARIDEALFSTVRGDARFVVIRVEREGHTPFRAVHPADATVPSLSWQTVRTRTLGVIDAARDPETPTRVWTRVEGGEDEALVITMALAPVE
jgi:hypothetical protein